MDTMAAGAPSAAAAPVVGEQHEACLLAVARAGVAVGAGRLPVAALDEAVAAARGIAVRAGAFVTLFAAGDELRGCMGTLDFERPVAESVAAAALMAATEDPRFRPLAAGELPALRLEVSVLGRPVPLVDPRAFVAGRDGIIVERRGRRGLLLPQVAIEHGLGPVEMLEAGCRKAGLSPDAWRDPLTSLSVFRVTRFGGPATSG